MVAQKEAQAEKRKVLLQQIQQSMSLNKDQRNFKEQTDKDYHLHNLGLQAQFAQKRDRDLAQHLQSIQDRDAQIYNYFLVSEHSPVTTCV